MVSQMSFTPESMRNSQQQAQKQRESDIQSGDSKERPVKEIMGDGVGVPP
jgi:hypothetical protein